MNKLMTLNQTDVLTMSSREIAELTGKQHGHVCRDIENLNNEYEKLALSKIGQGYYTHPNTGNQQHREFYLTREQCIDLITGYRTDLRIKINRRWVELEAERQLRIPQTLPEALRLAADLAEKYQALQAENKELRPKGAFVDNYVDAGTTKSLREVAKILNIPEKTMISRLIEDKLLFRQSGNLLPYQQYHVKGLFEVKTGTINNHNFTQTRVTAKGIEYIADRYASELF